MKVIRVFPRRTQLTPRDEYAFVGDPPMIRPEADEVQISVTFTWDIQEGWRLYNAWRQYYNDVKIGGPALGSTCGTSVPGLYLQPGVTFTSRGCNNQCSWCLVPEREGRVKTIGFWAGHIIQDNNLLQCDRQHVETVFLMLRSQRHAAYFSGGLECSLLADWVVEELQTMRINQLFLACDSWPALKPLQRAARKLSPLGQRRLRCYALLGYNGESIAQAEERLREIWHAGCMPFAQLYQPSGEYIKYAPEWRALARTWSRPAAMKALMRNNPDKKVDNHAWVVSER